MFIGLREEMKRICKQIQKKTLFNPMTIVTFGDYYKKCYNSYKPKLKVCSYYLTV